MMLSSRYNHNVDAKKRVFVPSRYRDELGEIFVVARSLRYDCLTIYSMEKWEEYIAPIYKMPREEQEPALRYFVGSSLEVSPDPQGRIMLTKELLDFASITKEVVIVGCGNYAEIWAAEAYDHFDTPEDREAVRESLKLWGL